MEKLNSRPELTKIIQEVATKKEIKNFCITEVTTNSKGEGFLGEIFLVKIKDGKSGKEMSLVLKVAFTNQIRELMPIRHFYENEVHFYATWSKILKDFVEERGESLDFIPKCLASSLENGKEVLVLENLRDQGFQVFDKKKVLDEDHVRLILKTYGRYHAFSFALQDQKPEELANVHFFNALAELLNEDFKEGLRRNAKSVAEILIAGEDDPVIKDFRKYENGGMADFFLKLATEKTGHPAILHGDCWSNNMMFKYQAGSPVDIRLLDFQVCLTGSPTLDLSYCLYSGASKEIFDDLEEFLRVYHESLTKTLKKLGSDVEKVYPFEVLREDWRKVSKFGMIMASMIIKIKTTRQEDMVDFTDLTFREGEDRKIFEGENFDKEAFGKRMRDLLWHMHNINAL